ncbi:MAG TPA: molybdopterin cofactor-binding domain-containing protein [Acidimicrobiia bacterium]
MATFAEVEVDTKTALVRVIEYVAAVDCGTAIDPKLAEGQVEGAIAQGIGYALYKQFQLDDRGRMRNRIGPLQDPGHARPTPDARDPGRVLRPHRPDGRQVERRIGINAPVLTIANAVYDAVGVRLRQTPFTPERVWEALSRKG